MRAPTLPDCWGDGTADPIPLSDERVAQIAKALAHPARLGILEQFEECQPHIATEIVGGCALAQSTVSEHLRILREAGILVTRKDGPRIWYCMRRDVLRDFVRAVDELAGTAVPAASR